MAPLLLTAALLAQTVDPPFLESTILTPPSSVSRTDGAIQLAGAASQSDAVSRVGAQATFSSDWLRFKLGIARAGVRDDAGFTLADGSVFTQAGLGLGVVAPLSDPLALGGASAVIPALVLQTSFDFTSEFDANVSNRLGAEAGFAVRVDVTEYAFVRVASTVEYELTGLISDLGRDDAISGRHAIDLALSLADRPALERAQLFVGLAVETPYSGYEKDPSAYFTLGVMYDEAFAPTAVLPDSVPAPLPEPPLPEEQSPTPGR